MEISQDLGHRPIIFIRFNPDDYKGNDMNITSCFMVDSKGICKIRISKEIEWEYRLNTLKDTIIYWMTPNNITDKFVEVVQLFFDV